ncbi:hypothetical protein DL765_009664 [Monosporascus sp. GIB2]|nr:hypothetical protein DL765_009664 [Monosporascus sp. GIB2]
MRRKVWLRQQKLTSDLKLKEDVIEVWRLDPSVYESAAAFAERTKSLPTLDIVVLNASMWSPSCAFNERIGREETIQEGQPIAGRSHFFTSSGVAGFSKFIERNKVPLLAVLDKKDIKVDAMDRMFLLNCSNTAVNHGEETHGQFLSFQEVVGKAPIIYTTKGKKASEQLRKETVAELASASVESILNDISAANC